MSNYENLSYLKLALEVLAPIEPNTDLMLLNEFVMRPETQNFMDNFAEELETRWLGSQQCIFKSEAENVEELEEDKNPSLDLFEIEATEKTAVSLLKQKSEVETIIEKNDEVIKELPQQPLQETSPKEEIEMKPIQPTIHFKLSNATVGRTYMAALETLGSQVVTLVNITGLDNLGLIYDVEQNLLEGEPLIAGDHKLTVLYQYQQNSYSDTMNLVINNDPKSLWKNIPSDTEVKYWKADDDNKAMDGLYEWKLIAASKRGRSHAHVGSCRDDDFSLTVDKETHWHIVAVADGAGSSEYSREGARVIVNNSNEVLSQQLKQHDASLMDCLNLWQENKTPENESALNEILYDVFAPAIISSIDKLIELAEHDERKFRDYYSTLLIAAHKPLGNGSFSIAYWIGDGGLGIYKAGKTLKLLGAGDSGDYAGQTRFLDIEAKNPDDIKKRLRFSFDREFTALILMTDGISDPLFETDNNLQQLDFWDVFWSNDIQPHLSEDIETSAAQLNDWLDFWSAGNHDDRTLALIYR